MTSFLNFYSPNPKQPDLMRDTAAQNYFRNHRRLKASQGKTTAASSSQGTTTTAQNTLSKTTAFQGNLI